MQLPRREGAHPGTRAHTVTLESRLKGIPRDGLLPLFHPSPYSGRHPGFPRANHSRGATLRRARRPNTVAAGGVPCGSVAGGSSGRPDVRAGPPSRLAPPAPQTPRVPRAPSVAQVPGELRPSDQRARGRPATARPLPASAGKQAAEYRCSPAPSSSQPRAPRRPPRRTPRWTWPWPGLLGPGVARDEGLAGCGSRRQLGKRLQGNRAAFRPG